MSRRNAHSNPIIALAFFIVMMADSYVDIHAVLPIYCQRFFPVFAVWSLQAINESGKHIYCSYQNAYHKPMNPSMICWDSVKN